MAVDVSIRPKPKDNRLRGLSPVPVAKKKVGRGADLPGEQSSQNMMLGSLRQNLANQSAGPTGRAATAPGRDQQLQMQQQFGQTARTVSADDTAGSIRQTPSPGATSGSVSSTGTTSIGSAMGGTPTDGQQTSPQQTQTAPPIIQPTGWSAPPPSPGYGVPQPPGNTVQEQALHWADIAPPPSPGYGVPQAPGNTAQELAIAQQEVQGRNTGTLNSPSSYPTDYASDMQGNVPNSRLQQQMLSPMEQQALQQAMGNRDLSAGQSAALRSRYGDPAMANPSNPINEAPNFVQTPPSYPPSPVTQGTVSPESIPGLVRSAPGVTAGMGMNEQTAWQNPVLQTGGPTAPLTDQQKQDRQYELAGQQQYPPSQPPRMDYGTDFARGGSEGTMPIGTGWPADTGQTGMSGGKGGNTEGAQPVNRFASADMGGAQITSSYGPGPGNTTPFVSPPGSLGNTTPYAPPPTGNPGTLNLGSNPGSINPGATYGAAYPQGASSGDNGGYGLPTGTPPGVTNPMGNSITPGLFNPMGGNAPTPPPALPDWFNTGGGSTDAPSLDSLSPYNPDVSAGYVEPRETNPKKLVGQPGQPNYNTGVTTYADQGPTAPPPPSWENAYAAQDPNSQPVAQQQAPSQMAQGYGPQYVQGIGWVQPGDPYYPRNPGQGQDVGRGEDPAPTGWPLPQNQRPPGMDSQYNDMYMPTDQWVAGHPGGSTAVPYQNDSPSANMPDQTGINSNAYQAMHPPTGNPMGPQGMPGNPLGAPGGGMMAGMQQPQPQPQPQPMWSPPGHQADPNNWQYDMQQGWSPPGQTAGIDGTQIDMGPNFDPRQRGKNFSIMMSPPGQQAPVDALNFTPETREVHPFGQVAPAHRMNLSLVPG